MVSRIEPDRYADTGFAVKDTPPEINARIFAAMMRRTPAERLMMCFDMMATGRALATYQYNQSSGAAIRWKDSAGDLPPRD
jgi:hypothetical protein